MISCSLTTGLVTLSGVAFGTIALGGGYLTVRSTHPWSGRSSPFTAGETSEYGDDGSTQRYTDSPPEPADSTQAGILDVLPHDETQIVEPVLTSPGITQSELRDRADFSKAKISQTVTDLEKRGLLYREEYGRTYRIYPDKSLSGVDKPRSDSA
ncbi:helix-turn-helix transcriptional regulator [Halocatena halophila]|uniref:helix-turn-helix transcriptional regulator n=1 Tax=Halocatena halophila TaxID=2814576 RepID=UPI002ED24496